MGALLNGKPVVCGGTTTGFCDGRGAQIFCLSLFNCQWSHVSQLREPRFQGGAATVKIQGKEIEIIHRLFQVITMVLYMSFDRFLLSVESHDLSQADKSNIRVFSFSNE